MKVYNTVFIFCTSFIKCGKNAFLGVKKNVVFYKKLTLFKLFSTFDDFF